MTPLQQTQHTDFSEEMKTQRARKSGEATCLGNVDDASPIFWPAKQNQEEFVDKKKENLVNYLTEII